jgi:hypothetical protein
VTACALDHRYGDAPERGGREIGPLRAAAPAMHA